MFRCRVGAAQAAGPGVSMSDPAIIPPAIKRYLRRHIARRRAVALARSVAVACIFAMLWMLAWGLVDRLFPLPAAVQFVLSLSGGGVIAAIILRPLGLMLRRRSDWVAAAAQ